MASVFLSYDRDDAAKAKSIARTLEKTGHTVWWDRNIRGGSQYSKEIEQALAAADAVVVLWSAQSVESTWVRDEAASGRDSGRLVPVTIDGIEPPLGFRQFQAIDLAGWKGRGRVKLEQLLDAISRVIGGEAPQHVSARSPQSARSFPGRAMILGMVAAILLTGAYFAWNIFFRPADIPTVAVAPANASPAAAALSQDLLTKLGELQSSGTNAIRLAGASDVKRADLLFKIDGSLRSQPEASLSLVGKDGGILWTGTFQQPSGTQADLKQQIGFTAARILGCASEGLQTDGSRLDQQTLKLYLSACAQWAETMRSDPTAIVRTLSQVVQKEPGFGPAWAKLLMAESEISGLPFNDGEPPRQILAELRRHIAEAKRLHPNMSEVILAEAALLPPHEFFRRTKLIEQAAAQDPDNPNVQTILAGAMLSTGRSRKAINASRRAVELDPLSPATVNNYISTLAYTGATDAAKRELAEAERLWPGTATVRDAQWRYHMRYGDPQIAKTIFEEDTDTGSGAWRLYLAAKIDPSAANVERLMAYVRERLKNMSNPGAGVGFATVAYAQFGRKEEIFSILLNWPKLDDLRIMTDVFFRPEFREARRDRRFMIVAQRVGLLDYWRTSGNWPDFCFDADKAYDCKAEAAKLAAAPGRQ